MTSNPIGWFEIYVQDMPRAKAFYEKVLQMELRTMDAPGDMIVEMEAFPMAGMNNYGSCGALVKMNGFTPSGNGTIVYFNCEDCSNEQGRIVAAGGKIQAPKMAIGEHGFCALAIDTEGNIFGLHSMK